MPTDVVMPQMGESIFEGTITKWLKKPGDKVQRDEPLFEISTDKVDAEIPAPSSGVLKEIKIQAGATVQVNTVVGVIDADGAGASTSAPQASTSASGCATCSAGDPGSSASRHNLRRRQMERQRPSSLQPRKQRLPQLLSCTCSAGWRRWRTGN